MNALDMNVFTGGVGGQVGFYTQAVFSNWAEQYRGILGELLSGKLAQPVIDAELDRAGRVAGAALDADPYAGGSAARRRRGSRRPGGAPAWPPWPGRWPAHDDKGGANVIRRTCASGRIAGLVLAGLAVPLCGCRGEIPASLMLTVMTGTGRARRRSHCASGCSTPAGWPMTTTASLPRRP